MRDFVDARRRRARASTLRFEGEGESEVGIVDARRPATSAKCKPGDVIVRVDPRYFRPTEVETLLGDPSKAKAKLGWVPKIDVRANWCAKWSRPTTRARKRDSLVKRPGSRPTTTTSRPGIRTDLRGLGQDGTYLAQLLLGKGYEVVGTSRDAQTLSFANLRRVESIRLG